jgi:hypothetical protein
MNQMAVERNAEMMSSYEGQPDVAMSSKLSKGGIDFNPDKMNLQVRNGTAGGIKFHFDAAMLEELRNAPGFVPVIISIQPLKSLPEFLGLNQSQTSAP